MRETRRTIEASSMTAKGAFDDMRQDRYEPPFRSMKRPSFAIIIAHDVRRLRPPQTFSSRQQRVAMPFVRRTRSTKSERLQTLFVASRIVH